jgi:DNA-binding Xre family transcriptional regulator
MDSPPQPTVNNPDGTTTVTITKLRVLIAETHKPAYITAAAAGLHPYTLSEYVQGKKPIKTVHLARLVEALNVPPEDIVGWVSFTLKDGEVLGQADVTTRGRGDKGTGGQSQTT